MVRRPIRVRTRNLSGNTRRIFRNVRRTHRSVNTEVNRHFAPLTFRGNWGRPGARNINRRVRNLPHPPGTNPATMPRYTGYIANMRNRARRANRS